MSIFTKVEPIVSPRSGRVVPNQYDLVTFERLETWCRPLVAQYQSYDSLCAEYSVEHDILTVYPSAFTSSTTSKYFHQWLKKYLDDDAVNALWAEAREEYKRMAPAVARSGGWCWTMAACRDRW